MLIVRNTGHRAFEGKALSQTELDHLLGNLEKIRGLPAWERKQQRLAEERKQEQQRLAEERREADEKAKQEQQRLAEAGDLEAQYQLGILYSGSTPISSKISPKRSSGLRKVLTGDTPMRSLLWARCTRKASAVS